MSIGHLLPSSPLPTLVSHIQKGIALRTTDPRFPTDSDIILTPRELRILLIHQQHMSDQKVWVTSAESGFPLEEEREEIHNELDDWEGKKTARFLHPVISELARHLNGKVNMGHNLTRIQRTIVKIDNEWMNPVNDPHVINSGGKVTRPPLEQKTRPGSKTTKTENYN